MPRSNPAVMSDLGPRPLALAHRLFWCAGVGLAVYLATSVGAGELTRNPLAVGGLLLLGIGLVREASRRLTPAAS